MPHEAVKIKVTSMGYSLDRRNHIRRKFIPSFCVVAQSKQVAEYFKDIIDSDLNFENYCTYDNREHIINHDSVFVSVPLCYKLFIGIITKDDIHKYYCEHCYYKIKPDILHTISNHYITSGQVSSIKVDSSIWNLNNKSCETCSDLFYEYLPTSTCFECTEFIAANHYNILRLRKRTDLHVSKAHAI